MARELEGAGCQPELLEIYTKCNAISIHLWNEHDSPTMEGELDEAAWGNAKSHYIRTVELVDRVAHIEGEPLSIWNPWDPVLPAGEEDEGE